MNNKSTFLLALFLFLPLSVFAEVVVLNSGQTIEGKIVEKSEDCIKMDLGGIVVTYYLDDIKSIDEPRLADKGVAENNLPGKANAGLPADSIDIDDIRTMLRRLGYLEHTWPDIERELSTFLTKIGFSQLADEARRLKSDPSQLSGFFWKIGDLLKQEGFLNYAPAHPLSKLLATGFSDEDIFGVIDSSSLSLKDKERLKVERFQCSAIAQLGAIILGKLGFDVKIATAQAHVFDYVILADDDTYFVDFTKEFFGRLDINEYYKQEGKYLVLKDKYRIPKDRMQEILKNYKPESGLEILNLAYGDIFLTEDDSCAFVIYSDYCKICEDVGNYDQAILDCNKSIKANADFSEAYYNRGLAYAYKGEYDKAISDYIKVIELKPNYANAYHNLAAAYSFKKDYDKSHEVVRKAKDLGLDINVASIESLEKQDPLSNYQ